MQTGNGRPALSCGWLELPSDASAEDSDNFVSLFSVSSGARNYSYLYDKSMYTTLWTAYPVYDSAMDGNYTASWQANPNLKTQEQINIWDGSYGVEDYSRGHLVPDASRDGNKEMLQQAYYATNQVPQIQDGFNGGIWAQLEGGIRDAVTSTCDTVYVVTGVAFNKVGESKTVEYIKPAKDTKECPVPNYFYKVALKVKRSGNQITAASAIGFWFEHKTYSGSYTTYAVSVNEIEKFTGLDYFVNLPQSLQQTAESNTAWDAFKSF